MKLHAILTLVGSKKNIIIINLEKLMTVRLNMHRNILVYIPSFLHICDVTEKT